MRLREFVKKHRADLDTFIRRKVPNCGTLNDAERAQWVSNDEGLYNWARREGVPI